MTNDKQLYIPSNHFILIHHSKLKSDLKTTKIEEMRVQMETFYQEIVRLQNFNGQSQRKG